MKCYLHVYFEKLLQLVECHHYYHYIIIIIIIPSILAGFVRLELAPDLAAGVEMMNDKCQDCANTNLFQSQLLVQCFSRKM